MKKIIIGLVIFTLSYNYSFAWGWNYTWKTEKLWLKCDFYRNVSKTGDTFIKYLNNWKDLFQYIKGYNEKTYNFNNVNYNLPENIELKNLSFRVFKINGKETILLDENIDHVRGEKFNFYILENNIFVKYLDNWKPINRYDSINNVWSDIDFLKKGNYNYIFTGFEDRAFLVKIDIEDFESIKIKDFISSKDKKHYLLRIEYKDKDYFELGGRKIYKKSVVINDFNISKKYLDISWLWFLKNSNRFWFYWVKDSNDIKKESKISFFLNFNEELNLTTIEKDGKEYYKFWNILFKTKWFIISILNNWKYYYWITENDEFRLYDFKWNLLINEKKAYSSKSISSENDNFLTIRLNYSWKIFTNNNWKFEEIYNPDLFSEERINKFWVEYMNISDFYYINNKLYFKLSLKKDNKYYKLLVNSLDFKQLPKLEYQNIFKMNYIDWNKDVFLWNTYENKKQILFNVRWDKSKWMNFKDLSNKDWDSYLLWVTDKLDIITARINDNNTYIIQKNNNEIADVWKKIPNIIFSKNKSKFFFTFFDKWKFIYDSDENLLAKINSNFSYTKDLKYISTDDMILYDWKTSFQEENNIIRKFEYSDDGNNLLFYVWDNRIWNDYICDLNNNKSVVTDIKIKKEIKIISKYKLFKQLILSKKALDNSSKWEMFKLAVDKRVYDLSDEKLIQFHNIVWEMNLNLYKYRKYKLVLEYMKAMIGMEIWKRDWIEKKEISKVVDSNNKVVDSNNKVYINSEYNYEFSYPKEWVIKEFPAWNWDFSPDSRNMLAIYSNWYLAQDYDWRIDVYNIDIDTVINDNKFIQYTLKNKGKINKITINWINWSHIEWKYSNYYLAYVNWKTYSLSISEEKSSIILESFKISN